MGKRKRILYVEWMDSLKSDHEPDGLTLIKSVGFLREKRKDCIILERDWDAFGGRAFLSIPKALIKKKVRL